MRRPRRETADELHARLKNVARAGFALRPHACVPVPGETPDSPYRADWLRLQAGKPCGKCLEFHPPGSCPACE